MEPRLIAMILGLALVLAATTIATTPLHAQLYPHPFHCNAQPRTGGGSCGYTGLGGNIENKGFPFGHPTGP